jgi:hypothetical protein
LASAWWREDLIGWLEVELKEELGFNSGIRHQDRQWLPNRSRWNASDPQSCRG